MLVGLAGAWTGSTDSKFSSFVRQLNFYGFRKVKSSASGADIDSRWWEFKVRIKSRFNSYRAVSSAYGGLTFDTRNGCSTWVFLERPSYPLT